MGYADGMAQGIRGLFDNLAKAGMVKEEAQQMAALRNAQAYNANMSGNKHGAEASGLEYTLQQRKAVPDMIAADPAMAPHMQSVLKAFGITGDTNIQRFANAGSEFQTQGIRDKAVANVDNLDKMNRFNTLAKEGQTYEPFKAVGHTGYSVNGATGTQAEANPVLAKLFGSKTNSEIGENNAQAANAFASAGQHKASTTKINTEVERMKAGGSGKPLTAAQLRENTAITEAREAMADMTQGEVQALLAKNTFDITPGDKQKLAVINLAKKPMFGESDVQQVSPQADPPAPPKKPGVIDQMRNLFQSKDAAAAPAAPTMDNKMQQSAGKIREEFKAGRITRDEAKRQLQSLGFN